MSNDARQKDLKMTLHKELLNAEIICENWATDLHFPKSAKAMAILAKFPLLEKIAMAFRSELDGKIWIEVPFNFEKSLTK